MPGAGKKQELHDIHVSDNKKYNQEIVQMDTKCYQVQEKL